MTPMTSATPKTKLDLYKERPTFFKAARMPELVDLPDAAYLVVDGQGEPGGANFQHQIGALFSVAYTIKMATKNAGQDFKVPTFEASWWTGTEQGELPPEKWRWQLLLMLPDFVDQADVERAKLAVAGKKRGMDPSVVRFQRMRQGSCVQMLHIGPYAAEEESIQKMMAFMAANGLEPDGPHHEVYLSDPNRCKPEALRTILRQHVTTAMDGKLTCPNAAKRDAPPKDDNLMTEACQECPALLRQVEERGTISYYCMVYHNRFRSPGAAIPLTAKPPNKASWSRGRLH
jgi:hypothetical protein